MYYNCKYWTSRCNRSQPISRPSAQASRNLGVILLIEITNKEVQKSNL